MGHCYKTYIHKEDFDILGRVQIRYSESFLNGVNLSPISMVSHYIS